MSLSQFITTTEDLAQLCQQFAKEPMVAVDTEFVWTRTYFPNLGIIQMGTGVDSAYIIDTVAIEDSTPLKELMEDKNVVKIFHDAGQDMAIINRYTGGTMHNIFDTQFACGFTGMGASLSLQKMIAALEGVELEKGATRTDWLKRPLDMVQVEYALDDVRYMVQCAKKLKKRAQERETDTLMQMAFDEMSASDVFNFEYGVKRHFKKIASRLKNRESVDRAYRLGLWLEETARTKNKPREHVLRKEIINELAGSDITTIAAIDRANFLNDRIKNSLAVELVEALNGKETAPEEWALNLKRPKPDSEGLKKLIEKYGVYIKAYIATFDIESVLVMNKATTTGLVRKYAMTNTFPELSGWRGELINKESIHFLNEND